MTCNIKSLCEYMLRKKAVNYKHLMNLLYYAHGWCLATYNRPLFRERIMAYSGGFYIEEVAKMYKHHGDNPIFLKKIIAEMIEKI